MGFFTVPSRHASVQYLKIVASHLKEVSSNKISKIFESVARQSNAMDDLHSALIGSAIKFATGVSTWGSTFVDKPLEPPYEQLFQRAFERSARSYFNQLLLATEASCFYLHALNKRLERLGSEDFKKGIYDSSVSALISWLTQTAASALGKESDSLNEGAFDALIKKRDLEYAQSPSLLGNDSDDQNSAVWDAARTISDEISIKDSFDREGYPNHVILTHIVGTVLMLELEALDLTARIERISLAAASQELSACFAPIPDQPQRLIESAARSDTNMPLADLVPNVSPTALQQRVQRAFFLLRTKAATFRSIPFSALNDRNRQGEVDYVPNPLPGIASSLTALGPSHGSRS